MRVYGSMFDPNNAAPITSIFTSHVCYQVKYWTSLTCLGRQMVKSWAFIVTFTNEGVFERVSDMAS